MRTIFILTKVYNFKGRHYAKKKNRVANFRKNYEYTYESISKDNIGEVIDFQEKGINFIQSLVEKF